MYYTFDGNEIKNGVWQPIDPYDYNKLSYGDFHEFKGTVTDELLKTLYVMPDLLSGGDYCNSSEVHISNHRIFLKEFGKVTGVHNLYGGYGTFAIAIRADIAESHEGIKETLDGLDDYPVIDEEDMSKLRNDWEQEAVKEMVHNVQRSIENDLEEYMEDTEVDSDKIELLIWDGINDLNLDWSYESNSAYMDDDKVIPFVEDQILLERCKRTTLPLLITRQWSCKATQNKFESKLKGE
jgi:hypothetical protein